MDIDSFEVNVTKSWFGICDPGQTFPMHYHSCAHISFIYYVQPTGDPIVFHTENPNQWFGAAFSFTGKQNGLNVRDYVIEPKPESLLLFPGSIEQYTPVDREHTRISLAGDIVLTLKKHKAAVSLDYSLHGFGNVSNIREVFYGIRFNSKILPR